MSEGAGEGETRRAKGNIGGSTTVAWLLESERRQAREQRGPVVGGPARSCHLLARPGPPRGSAHRGGRSGLECVPIRYVGAPARPGQESLSAALTVVVVVDGERVLLQCAGQRHPERRRAAPKRYDDRADEFPRSLPIRRLTREGDVRADVGPAQDPTRDVNGGLFTTRLELEREIPPRTPSLSSEGDVQGDVDHPCFSDAHS
jgi:hypothetical protein